MEGSLSSGSGGGASSLLLAYWSPKWAKRRKNLGWALQYKPWVAQPKEWAGERNGPGHRSLIGAGPLISHTTG